MSHADFTRSNPSEILPLLCKQKESQDEIIFASPAGKDGFAQCLWNNNESADDDNRAAFAEVSKFLSKRVAGTPGVKSCDLANANAHPIAATQKVAW